MSEQNAAVDRALEVLPPFTQGPLIPPAARGREEDLVATYDACTPGTLYTEGRDTSLPEFVVLQLGCGRKQRLEQLPPVKCYGRPVHADGTVGVFRTPDADACVEVFPPIRLINLDGMATTGAHLTATLGEDPIALPEDSVDLVLATHVLEHIGVQGELRGWFQFWGEIYRVMRPNARLQFLSPYYTSVWCWADPTHTRAISEYAFLYLHQDSYRVPADQTAIPDYRPPCDFTLERWSLLADTTNESLRRREGRSHMEGVLVAHKPFQPYWEDAR